CAKGETATVWGIYALDSW
nr:immunoglobulin heavy chain junction region [Macaca mulatta]MOW46078.1 immunoglobulin heavy chain junction region [Macaca mulatta]MOW46252.1 immunoglobulin heavy chain junction region [Macaca mulatta]MOW46777.1 immunoglobulin heavy chain junction region [Macaca mulatta]MOW46964.1 immunoglobulin heavy chain junction region [Macaca mulatta]